MTLEDVARIGIDKPKRSMVAKRKVIVEEVDCEGVQSWEIQYLYDPFIR